MVSEGWGWDEGLDGSSGWGKVMVVQPRVGRVCWCSGRTRGRGAGMSGGLWSCLVCDCAFWFLLFRVDVLVRMREMNFAMEKL